MCSQERSIPMSFFIFQQPTFVSRFPERERKGRKRAEEREGKRTKHFYVGFPGKKCDSLIITIAWRDCNVPTLESFEGYFHNSDPLSLSLLCLRISTKLIEEKKHPTRCLEGRKTTILIDCNCDIAKRKDTQVVMTAPHQIFRKLRKAIVSENIKEIILYNRWDPTRRQARVHTNRMRIELRRPMHTSAVLILPFDLSLYYFKRRFKILHVALVYFCVVHSYPPAAPCKIMYKSDKMFRLTESIRYTKCIL